MMAKYSEMIADKRNETGVLAAQHCKSKGCSVEFRCFSWNRTGYYARNCPVKQTPKGGDGGSSLSPSAQFDSSHLADAAEESLFSVGCRS